MSVGPGKSTAMRLSSTVFYIISALKVGVGGKVLYNYVCYYRIMSEIYMVLTIFQVFNDLLKNEIL